MFSPAVRVALRVLEAVGQQRLRPGNDTGERDVSLSTFRGLPLAPAAVRLERTRVRGRRRSSHQTAVTLWFGSGPSLPAAGAGHPALRAAARFGGGMLAAAALAAATTVAARRLEQQHARPLLEAAAAPEAGEVISTTLEDRQG